MAYLIQGCFFQPTQFFGIGYRGDGLAAIVREGMGRFPFFGAVHSLTDPPSFWWEGDMHDNFGPSKIGEWVLSLSKVTFTKIYLKGSRGSRGPIHYRFEKQTDGTWIGTYEGEECGQGLARCVITKVGDDFFQAPISEPSPVA